MKFQKIFSDWAIGAALTLIFLFIIFSGSLDFTHTVEMKSYDLRARLAASDERSPDIELVTITNDDINEIGRWPWPRSYIAECIDNLHEAGAKVIALNIYLTEPEENAGLKIIKNLKKEFDDLHLAQTENNGLIFYQKMTDAEKDIDNDAKLEKAIKNAGNVVLPFFFDTVSQGRDETAPAFIVRDSFKNMFGVDDDFEYAIVWYTKITPPLRRFAEVAAGTGYNNMSTDESDGYVRMQRHVVGYLDDIYVPSYAVAVVKLFKGLSDDNVRLSLSENKGRYLDLKVTPTSNISVPLQEYSRGGTLINWKMGPDKAYHRTSFSKVLNKEIQMSLFKDKIVIIGHVAPGIDIQRVTPVSGTMPDMEVLANTVDNILNQKFYYKPFWAGVVELITLIFFGFFISFVLPRLKAGTGAVTALFLFLAYGIGGSYLFFSGNIWLEISAPLILLVAGYILIISKRFLVTERTKEKVEADSAETNKMLGISFQQQGMLDLALDKFRKIPIKEEGAKELLYNLGLDFERKRQFSKALSTYNMIIEDGKNYKDLSERIPKLKGAEATMIFGGGGHPGDIGATLVNTDTKPTLGRYEVTDELGRGAMGVVYKGEDPKIHRTVAIKTVRLSDFDDSMVDEMKERFFREAESAGLLTHPNIVTIYDAGEEHDLAYIAMEFLKGKDLEEHTKKGNLLSVRETISIISQVAEALEYAHNKGIVHRDIKPANIMRINETGEVKVADFGIARITASSKTKTGVIMGTPSYMSPEQVSGQKVDGRSDIFSLGVVLFEMLCGEKPFKGEDMTSMMFKIAREKHPSVKTINPKIPVVIEKVIDKAMEKDVNERYQKAGQMAGHLKIILKRIDEAANRKKSANNQ